MIKEIRINSVDELMPLLTELKYRPDLDRSRSLYVYRGVNDASFPMMTSLRRNCKDLQRALEPAILKNFAKYAMMDDPTLSQSVWRQMILGRHHGLPTRLLDLSHSPLVALHFSLIENNMDEMEAHDCAVWRMDITELHSLLPAPYAAMLKSHRTGVFTVDMLSTVCATLPQYDEDMRDKAMVVIEPPSIDSRIVNQYSFFSVIPSEMVDIETFLDRNTSNTVKFVIDRRLRWHVRDILDQLNMSERIVYPGLDGLSKWIARHYFVKKK